MDGGIGCCATAREDRARSPPAMTAMPNTDAASLRAPLRMAIPSCVPVGWPGWEGSGGRAATSSPRASISPPRIVYPRGARLGCGLARLRLGRDLLDGDAMDDEIFAALSHCVDRKLQAQAIRPSHARQSQFVSIPSRGANPPLPGGQ